ncbi:hypothetical protein LIA77_08177 [Sarocladium implicatum]|nr:hypothetical protein LIA77_08177 [Sarocladium implicatum]
MLRMVDEVREAKQQMKEDVSGSLYASAMFLIRRAADGVVDEAACLSSACPSESRGVHTGVRVVAKGHRQNEAKEDGAAGPRKPWRFRSWGVEGWWRWWSGIRACVV